MAGACLSVRRATSPEVAAGCAVSVVPEHPGGADRRQAQAAVFISRSVAVATVGCGPRTIGGIVFGRGGDLASTHDPSANSQRVSDRGSGHGRETGERHSNCIGNEQGLGHPTHVDVLPLRPFPQRELAEVGDGTSQGRARLR